MSTNDIARDARSIRPRVSPSPLPGYEYVRGYGVYSLPLDTGHVLALRVFPENDFAPYRTIWHRSPDGAWTIYADSPRLDIACPRYYSSAARRNVRADLSLDWTGPRSLSIRMKAPRLRWDVSMASTPRTNLVNALSGAIPERIWRTSAMLRAFEAVGRHALDLGDVTLSGNAPNGHFALVMPRRMYPIESSTARLGGEDLGKPVRAPENPSIGALRLPARPVFAIGRAYFEMQDPEAYRRTVEELRSRRDGPPA